MYCKQLRNLPVIATDWQMYAVCPGCQWYKDGQCKDLRRKSYEAPCEFEVTGGKLPLKMVPTKCVTDTHG